jgi:NAD(P)-dependent dehydrogenase (short-subunit alcohol dehydrogenase family)
VVLTGATSGIGLASARLLASRSDHLILHGPEGEREVATILRELSGSSAKVDYVPGDFTRLAGVRSVAARVHDLAPAIDVLVNNAGMPGAPQRRLTEDGIEQTFQVNFVAAALLTAQLLPALAPGGRVVHVSSTTHRMASLDFADLNLDRGYTPVRAYAQSKLAMLIHAQALAEDDAMRDRLALAISPGVISTDLLHAMFGSAGMSLEHGAERVIGAVQGDYATGSYVDDGQLVTPSDEARDRRVRELLMAYLASTTGSTALA